MNKQLSDEKLTKALAELPNEIAPERDLWPGIEKAIAITPQLSGDVSKKRLVPVAWAASVALAAVLTWGIMAPDLASDQSSIDLVSVMELDFKEQRSVMLASFGQNNISALPQDMQLQLNALEKARKSIIAALKEQPNNGDLLNLLRFTQQQELNLLEKLYSPQWQTI